MITLQIHQQEYHLVKIQNKSKLMTPIFSMGKRSQPLLISIFQVTMEVMNMKLLKKLSKPIVTMHQTQLMIKLNSLCYQRKELEELLKYCLRHVTNFHLKKYLHGFLKILILLGIITTKIMKDGLDMKRAFNSLDIFLDH